MQEAEFDKFADEYHRLHQESIGASGEDPEYFFAYKIRDLLLESTKRMSMHGRQMQVLDFGSGSGNSIPYIRDLFQGCSLTCADVSKRSLELAAQRFPEQANFVRLESSVLPFPDNSIDIVFAACVFHHIDGHLHRPILSEWRRVLRPGGMAMLYEHNPLNALTRRVVNSRAFDVNAKLISGRAMKRNFFAAGFTGAEVSYRVYFPKSLRMLRPLERVLSGIPLGAQYYAVALKGMC